MKTVIKADYENLRQYLEEFELTIASDTDNGGKSLVWLARLDKFVIRKGRDQEVFLEQPNSLKKAVEAYNKLV